MRLLDWLKGHPATRAGAAAFALAKRPRGSSAQTSLGRRWAGQIVGSALVALGVGVTIATDIGVGPLDLFNIGLADVVDVPLAIAVWSVAAAMMVLATLLGNPPRLGTLITPFVIGAVLQPVSDALGWLSAAPFALAMVAQVFGVTTIGVGAGAIVVSGFGAGLGELISEATSWRFGRSMSTMRLCLEGSLLVLGILLGGPFGPGTVLVAVLIGPSVARGVRWSEPLINGSLRTPDRSAEPSGTPLGSPSRFLRRHGALEAVRALARR